ncbi:type II toxin-antitoxin system HipA family toxin [Propionivibrio sp.]|uniref:type II toxin-antitoxin system HipA family toxin n=1 Tax=Propionivibrio sp. TaxID=2212460 RepID=UPI003BF3BE4A
MLASKTRWFGIFLDVAPDRWGRVLMERREALAAKDEKRTMQRLTDFDFMLGVSDMTRTGALRFRFSPETPFVAPDEMRAVPPVTSLGELADVVANLEDPSAEERPEYRKWLSMLLAPGTSLGGARPKATFREADGRLWLAKFPSRNDRRDWGAWEFITHALARKAGIDVPAAQYLRLGAQYHTFCVERFDRQKVDLLAPASRRLYASAMTLLARQDGEPDGTHEPRSPLFVGARRAVPAKSEKGTGSINRPDHPLPFNLENSVGCDAKRARRAVPLRPRSISPILSSRNTRTFPIRMLEKGKLFRRRS